MVLFKRILFVIILFAGVYCTAFSQRSVNQKDLAGQENAILSTVPFLSIAPDSKAGSMGDVGVATSPDANSQHWNLAKYCFIEYEGGVALSYIPWLRNLGIKDINLLYLSSYKKIDKRQSISGSLRYFTLGNIIFTNENGETISDKNNPNEFAVDVGYSLKLSEYFSAGIAFRFIRSDLATRVISDLKAGIAGASDIGFYYQKDIKMYDKKAQMAYGLNISNLGTKISYSETADPEFIPVNMRLGSRMTIYMDNFNAVSFAVDLNKLLVPTPDTAKQTPKVSVPVGVVNSFVDAPGGFNEEINEIMYSIGAEYSYQDRFFLRGGYFYENVNKGNRKYMTLGIGIKFSVLTTDFSYLITTSDRNSPLANTIRFSLLFNFEANNPNSKSFLE